MLFRWPWSKAVKHDDSLLREERAKTQKVRAAMSEAVISMNRERHELDEMVRRSLLLLEQRH